MSGDPQNTISAISPTEVAAGNGLPVHPRLVELRDKVDQAVASAKAESTRKAYGADWIEFEIWCATEGFSPLPAPPAVVAAYAADLGWPSDDRAPLAVATIGRRLAAIAHEHRRAGLSSPCDDPLVREAMAGIRRTLGVAPQARKRPVSTEDLRAAVHALGDRVIDARDRAILLVGYAGGFRRSELVGVDVGDVEERPEGVVVTLRRSKRDQEGRGREIPLVYGQDAATCPVRALRGWLERAGITDGPVFRAVDRHGNVAATRLSAQSIALVVKRHMGPLGFDTDDFAGHSLRRGMATTASRNGAPDRTIMGTTGHASPSTLAPYIAEAHQFDDPASGYLGL